MLWLEEFGTEEQKEKFLRPLARGERLAHFFYLSRMPVLMPHHKRQWPLIKGIITW